MGHPVNELLAGLWNEQSSSSESDLDDFDLDGNYQPPSVHASCEEVSTADDGSESGEETPESSMDVDNKKQNVFLWTKDLNNFRPKMNLPAVVNPMVLADVNRSTNELDTFLELFPNELFEKIALYTNMRLEIKKSAKKNKNTSFLNDTFAEEMMIVMGCVFAMCYNKLPAMHMYWSTKSSLGNSAISNGISRNRFQKLFAKLYFADPKKPQDASKTYYMDELLACLKSMFTNARSNTTYRSRDESMTKFKGRSSLKQYIPLKPIKKGIKLWTRCVAKTEYVHDTNIYRGKESECVEGTLGERVVKKIVESVRNDAVLISDRFFTSTNLLNSIEYAAVRTSNKNRKNVAQPNEKFTQKGESEMAACKEGLQCVPWKNTKDVLLMSNCRTPEETEVQRKKKNRTIQEISCPVRIMQTK